MLLALGVLGLERYCGVTELGLKTDERNNVAVDDRYMASEPGVFACGDARRGQSLLVVWPSGKAASAPAASTSS